MGELHNSWDSNPGPTTASAPSGQPPDRGLLARTPEEALTSRRVQASEAPAAAAAGPAYAGALAPERSTPNPTRHRMWLMAALLAVLLVIFVVVLAGRDANASSTTCTWVEHVLDGRTNDTASATERAARQTGVDQIERLSQPSDVIRIVRRTDHGAETCTIELASSAATPTPARRAAA